MTSVQRGSTIFLKGVVVLTGLVVLGMCAALPFVALSDTAGYAPILFGLYAPALPFFFALYQALKLLGLIDKNKAFSEVSVSALKNIKYCGFVISALFMAGMPYVFYVADNDDAPGVVALGLVIVGASFVIGVFAALMQRLLHDALVLKSENDLTV